MRKTLGIIAFLISAICILLAIWDPADWQWLKLLLTSVIFALVGIFLCAPAEPQKRL